MAPKIPAKPARKPKIAWNEDATLLSGAPLETAPPVPRFEPEKQTPPKPELERPSLRDAQKRVSQTGMEVEESAYARMGRILFGNDPEKETDPLEKTIFRAETFDRSKDQNYSIKADQSQDDRALAVFDTFEVPETKLPMEYGFVDMGNGFVQVELLNPNVSKDCGGKNHEGTLRFRVPATGEILDSSKAKAVLHTHPLNESIAQWYKNKCMDKPFTLAPGDADIGVTTKYRVPHYVQHEGRIGVIEVDAGQLMFRIVWGVPFNKKEAAEIQTQMDKLQRELRGRW